MVSPVAPPYRPASQKAGSDEPATQKLPRVHGWQLALLVPPVAELYVPAAQGAAVALLLPAAQKWPLAQLPEHCESVSCSALPTRPAGHELGSEPPTQK